MKKLLLLLLLSTSALAEQSKWETVSDGMFEVSCYRMSVPHGWIVITRVRNGAGMIFYQDEKHEWKIK